VPQDCSLYLCEAAALQKEMEMALIMNVAALKLCCKESKEEACAAPERRPWPNAAAGAQAHPGNMAACECTAATVTDLRAASRADSMLA